MDDLKYIIKVVIGIGASIWVILIITFFMLFDINIVWTGL